jgi:hypothetical protein
MKLVAIILSMFSTIAYSDNYFSCLDDCGLHLLEPRDSYIDVYQNDTVRDPYLEPLDKTLGYGSTFNLDVDVLKYRGYGLYWNNQLFFDQETISHHIRHGGWRYEVGFVLFRTKLSDRYFSKIELFKQHQSRHLLEDIRPVHFPVYDRTGIRLWITHKN